MSKSTILLVIAIVVAWFLFKKQKSNATVTPVTPAPEVNQYDNFELNKIQQTVKRNPRLRAKYGKLANRLGVHINDAISMGYSS